MKNIIIGGVSRAGKSTIAKSLAKRLGYNWIPLDPLLHSFAKTFPDLNIRHTGLTHEQICQNFSEYLNNYLEALLNESNNSGEFFIIESYHLKPSLLNQKILDNYNTSFVGFSEISVEEKFQQVRKFDIKDWTTTVNDSDLKGLISQFISESKMYKKECNEYSTNYFDVSFDFKVKQEEIIDILSK